MTEDRVRVTVGGDGVAQATMVRADKHNALDPAMFQALRDAAEQLRTDSSVRAVVLHGEGKSFCSGLDIASLGDQELGASALTVGDEDGHPANKFQRAAYDWNEVPVPVIAAIHGNCFGGGIQIALGADIRIAAPDAKLSVMEVKWGLIPDMGISHNLPRLVGIDVAKELTFTGRIFSGAEADELGVVTRCADDPLEAALELAREIAGKSPDAIRSGKRLFNDTWNTNDPAFSLGREATLQQDLILKPNQLAAIAAGMSGEPPQFEEPTVLVG